MKAGDLVRISARGPELFFVLGRRAEVDRLAHADASKFSDWVLLELLTGQRFYQIKRTLEVVSENR